MQEMYDAVIVGAGPGGSAAAHYLAREGFNVAAGDFSVKQLTAYDTILRQHYQRLFVLYDQLRMLYLNPLILNQVVRAVARDDELMALLMNIAIDNQDAYKGLAPRTIAKVIFGGIAHR